MQEIETRKNGKNTYSCFAVLKKGIFGDFKKYQIETIGYERYVCRRYGGEYIIGGKTKSGLNTRTVARFSAKTKAEEALIFFMNEGRKVWDI